MRNRRNVNDKELIRNVVQNDEDGLPQYYWVKVCLPLERWFKEEGGNPIPSCRAAKLLHKSKWNIKEVGDGIHYVRRICADKIPATKAIYGFSSMSVYKTVVRKIEEYAGFIHHDDSEQPIDSQPELSEDLDYRDNHPNPQIALSMEVIIQIENIWEDGIMELSPYLKICLQRAVKTLQEYSAKTPQINSLIKDGTYYDKNMDVLICHDDGMII